jgi:hypothetical protein
MPGESFRFLGTEQVHITRDCLPRRSFSQGGSQNDDKNPKKRAHRRRQSAHYINGYALKWKMFGRFQRGVNIFPRQTPDFMAMLAITLMSDYPQKDAQMQ